jgi:hypothetical protein
MSISTTNSRQYQRHLSEPGFYDLHACCGHAGLIVSSISDIGSYHAHISESAVVSISALSSVFVSLIAWQRSGRIAYKVLSGRVRDSASRGLPWLDKWLSNIYARAAWRMMATPQTLWSKMRRYMSSVFAWRGSYIGVSNIFYSLRVVMELWRGIRCKLRLYRACPVADIALSNILALIFAFVKPYSQIWRDKTHMYILANRRGSNTAWSNKREAGPRLRRRL